jgi:hypothetical protein
MVGVPTLDRLVRDRLRQWPQRPPGLVAGKGEQQGGRDGWLRGRPDLTVHNVPFLKLPGADRFRTLPDGLWMNFGGTVHEPYVDIFAIEACGSLTNLLDKRSRFAPSTHSLLAVCPVQWLMRAATPTDPTPRWQVTRVLAAEPLRPLVLPVRDIKVMYALKTRHYRGFTETQIPHPHEYFVPMDAITAKDGHESPAIKALVSRAAVNANFLATC